MYLHIPLATGGMWHKVSFSAELLLVLNSEFSLLTGCLSKDKESKLLDYLPIAEVKTDGFMHFPRPLVSSKMPTVSSRIWTRIGNSVSYNNNSNVYRVSYCAIVDAKK